MDISTDSKYVIFSIGSVYVGVWLKGEPSEFGPCKFAYTTKKVVRFCRKRDVSGEVVVLSSSTIMLSAKPIVENENLTKSKKIDMIITGQDLIDPLADNAILLQWLVENQTDNVLLQHFLQQESIQQYEASISHVLHACIVHDNIDALKAVLAVCKKSSIGDRLLCDACIKGNADMVEIMLGDGRFDPSSREQYPIQLAAKHNHLNIVKRLLLDERVDPSGDENLAICNAADNGHLDVLNCLLADPRVDPGDKQQKALRAAAGHGHEAIVMRLLQDSRVNLDYAIASSGADAKFYLRKIRKDGKKRQQPNGNDKGNGSQDININVHVYVHQK